MYTLVLWPHLKMCVGSIHEYTYLCQLFIANYEIGWYQLHPKVLMILNRAPERWEQWERVPSQFVILAATFG